MTENSAPPADVIVIGGGAGGLSAALALGRSRRRVVVIDDGRPRNATSPHSHGVLGQDGLAPAEILERGRADLAPYDVTFETATAERAQRIDDATFAVSLADGRVLHARRLVLAGGSTDELPAIPGLRERWGIDVVHCPYCHGWEVRDKKVVVISTTAMGAHSALLFRQWSDDVSLIVHDGPPPTAQQALELAARNIAVLEGTIDDVLVADGHLVGLRMASGHVVDADAVAVRSRVTPRSSVIESLGLTTRAHPLDPDAGTVITTSPTGQTDVPGVFAAGNVADLAATIPASIASGYLAGAMANFDLVEEETRSAVTALTASTTNMPTTVMDGSFWDERYRSAPQIWSGNPNPHVVSDLTGVAPGRALDVGAGEGADAIWLAQQGWTVTAADISTVALERGRTQAMTLGTEVADRITWQHADLLDPAFPDGTFDLVTLQFIHLASSDRATAFRRCAQAVAPGGLLLIAAHHPSDMNTTLRRPRALDLFYTAEELVALLDDTWTVLAADARPRTVKDGRGRFITARDTVLLARRAS